MYEANEVYAIKDNEDITSAKALNKTSFVSTQEKDPYYRQLVEDADTPVSHYFHDEFGILARRAWLDGLTQNVVTVLLRARMLIHEHD